MTLLDFPEICVFLENRGLKDMYYFWHICWTNCSNLFHKQFFHRY